MDTSEARQRVRAGGLRGDALLAWLAAMPPLARDQSLEELLVIETYPALPRPPGDELVGYVPSGISALVQAVFATPVTQDDVFVDLGAGLGKAAMAVHLLTGARARGIEREAALVTRARAAADALDLRGVEFIEGDARAAALHDGTVFFLYLPFTGSVLAAVLARLEAEAARRPLVVATLGLDLPGTEAWLARRETDGFWLSLYDSTLAGPPPAGRRPRPLTPHAAAIAQERYTAPSHAP